MKQKPKPKTKSKEDMIELMTVPLVGPEGQVFGTAFVEPDTYEQIKKFQKQQQNFFCDDITDEVDPNQTEFDLKVKKSNSH